MKNNLSTLQAFNAMVCFFEIFYKSTYSDNMGSLLGDVQMLIDGCTADPAAWEDWLKSVQTTLKQENKTCNVTHIPGDEILTPLEAFKAMIHFLERYYNNTSFPEDIGSLLMDMHIINNTTTNPQLWKDWIKIVNDSNKINTIHFLCLQK